MFDFDFEVFWTPRAFFRNLLATWLCAGDQSKRGVIRGFSTVRLPAVDSAVLLRRGRRAQPVFIVFRAACW